MNEIDHELVGRLVRGERAAFDEFFNEYYPKLYRFVKRRLPSDSATCEDVAQATLCRALESLHGYRGEAALMTWLCTICRRELSARWRENQGWAGAPALAEDDPEIRAALESLLASEQGDPLLVTSRALRTRLRSGRSARCEAIPLMHTANPRPSRPATNTTRRSRAATESTSDSAIAARTTPCISAR